MLYDDNGQIEFERTDTGRRIIAKERLVKYLQYKDLLVNDMFYTKQDVIYARVSTHKQKTRRTVAELNDVEIVVIFK